MEEKVYKKVTNEQYFSVLRAIHSEVRTSKDIDEAAKRVLAYMPKALREELAAEEA